MNHYIGEILRVLNLAGTDCGYVAKDRCIHARYKYGNAEIFCFFDFGLPGRIASYSVCSVPVSAGIRQETERKLSEINGELPSGRFHMDADSNSIVFHNDYPAQTANFTETVKEGLAAFCLRSFEAFRSYGDVLYARNENKQENPVLKKRMNNVCCYQK